MPFGITPGLAGSVWRPIQGPPALPDQASSSRSLRSISATCRSYGRALRSSIPRTFGPRPSVPLDRLFVGCWLGLRPFGPSAYSPQIGGLVDGPPAESTRFARRQTPLGALAAGEAQGPKGLMLRPFGGLRAGPKGQALRATPKLERSSKFWEAPPPHCVRRRSLILLRTPRALLRC